MDQMTTALTARRKQPVSRGCRWLRMRQAVGDIFVGKGSYVQVSNIFLQDMVESKADKIDMVNVMNDTGNGLYSLRSSVVQKFAINQPF